MHLTDAVGHAIRLRSVCDVRQVLYPAQAKAQPLDEHVEADIACV